MNISSISITRPVLATVISIFIVLFGIIGFTFLGVREYPSVDPPIITVTTNYTGANADIIESQITEPLEESINGIAGIRSLTSISSDGRSTITVEFELDVDLEAAANDVRDRVSRAVRNLPTDTDPPIVAKSDADSSPILSMTIQSDQRSLLELSELANNVFKERLQTIPGVSEIRIWGEKKFSMKLQLDPVKMAGYGITPGDVRAALERENVELPSGRIEGYSTELSIRTLGRLTTEEDFNDMILREDGNTLVRLRDVGIARLAPENERTLLRGNGGIPQVAVAVTPQAGSNYVEIADEFYKRAEQIQKELPGDLRYNLALDTTISIRKAITEVQETILIAFLLVVLIIFIFLRDWRTTLIPVLAIPISLIGAFFIMYVADFSINILTLLAVVLATGIVVDDAIVVLENIYSKIEGGMDPIKAGHQGSREITFAIISTTLTITAVFLPVIFLSGLTGRLFREFGVVVAGSVIISALVSLTLTPIMSARFLKHKTKHSRFFEVTERWFNKFADGYRGSLTNFLAKRWVVFPIMIISIVLIVIAALNTPSELAPMEDKSRYMVMSTAPEGTSYEMMLDYLGRIIETVDTMPETQSILSVTSPGFGGSISVNSGFVRVTLVDPSDRERTQDELAKEVNALVQQHNLARTFVIQEATIGSGRGRSLPVQFVIQAPTLDRLREVIPAFLDSARQHPSFQVVDLNLKFNKPELTVEIDRDRARTLGVSVRDIAETLQLYFSGQRFGYFILNGKQYQVIGQASRQNRDAPIDLATAYVRNNEGELIQLANLVRTSDQSSPPQLYRYNRYVSATVSASMKDGYTLGDGIEAMEGIAGKVLDDSFSTALDGESKEFQESSSSLLFAFGLALILVFLILAAQFESWIDPLIVMFTVPLALAGALLSLWLGGHTLNIFSQIGIIVLIGLVTKNGILIVEFANQKMDGGLSKCEAAIEAATQRFRPILMTTLATVLGVLPIALGLGAAAKSRVPMGTALIGGLIFALVLTLFVIPALYSYVAGETPISLAKKIIRRIRRLFGAAFLFSLAYGAVGQDTMNVITPEEAVSIALEHNYGIRIARLEARTSEVLNNAGNAGMLPTLDANGILSVDNSSTRQVFFSGEVRDAENANTRVIDGALSLNWTIFDGLAMFAAKDRLEALETIGRTELRQQVENTIYEVLNNYFLAVQLKSAVAVQVEGLITSRERMSIAETGERLGAASGLELVQARLDMSADSSALLELLQQEAIAINRLNAALGQSPTTPIAVAEGIPPAGELDLTTIQERARTGNNVLLQARQMQELTIASVNELRGALFPRVDLFGNYGYRRSTSDVGFLQSSRAIGPDYGARISIPLFRGGQTRSALEVARITREQAELTTAEAQLQLEQQILDGWAIYTTARQRLRMEENNLSGIRQQVEVALESYRLGIITPVELRDVQQGLIDAENRLLVAQYEAKMAGLQLELLSGALNGQ